MGRLFDYQLPEQRRVDLEARPQRPRDTAPPPSWDIPEIIWQALLDHGADPLALAALLRHDLSPSERRRAYLELVGTVGGELASQILTDANARPLAAFDFPSERRAFPVAMRELAEGQTGVPLVGVHVATGRLVSLIADRLETPAFTLGSDVFLRSDGEATEAVLVHEALHAAQQTGAAPTRRPRVASRAAEDEVHRIMRRLGPWRGRSAALKERARAATVVRAALGRGPRLSRHPSEVAAFEPTRIDEATSAAEVGRRLAEALAILLSRGAGRDEIVSALGPRDDDFQARARRVAMQTLQRRSDGEDLKQALLTTLGAEVTRWLAGTLIAQAAQAGSKPGKAVPDDVRAEVEPRLGVPLDDVRLHDDAQAARRADALDANAFTEGRDVYFAPGKLDAASPEGRHRLKHELAHVAQQRAAGDAGALPRAVSAPSSAIERDAERAASTGSPVREQAPAGTISRDSGDAKPKKWLVNFLQEALQVDLATATDWANGMKKVTLPLGKVGPVNLNELIVRLADDGNVERGELKATIDDGKLKGTQATLTIDRSGGVTGSLDLPVKVQNVLDKVIPLVVKPDGLSAAVTLSPNDFLSKEFPVQSSQLSIKVDQKGASLDVRMEGSAVVGLDQGFAEGKGTLTATIAAGAGGFSIDANVDASLQVPGLGTTVKATLGWDGKKVTVEAGATVDVNIPGVKGTAQISYKDGKLSGKVPDLAFTLDAIKGIQFEDVGIEKGKLKGKAKVAGDTTLDLGGVELVLKADSSLAIDGATVAGKASGEVKLGPKGSPLLTGTFELGYGAAGLDGELTLGSSAIPFITVSGVKLSGKGLGKTNQIAFSSGTIGVDLGGVVTGSITNLGFAGGSPTGSVKLKVAIPGVDLPEIGFDLLAGWKVKATSPELKAAIDFGQAAIGKLEKLAVDLKTTAGELRELPKTLGDLSVSGNNIAIPGLEGLVSIETLALKIPGSGGKYDLKAATGNAVVAAQIGTEKVALTVSLAGGKLSAKSKKTLQVSSLVKALTGTIEIDFDTDKPGLITVEAKDVKPAYAGLADKVKVEAKFADKKLTGSVTFAGEVDLDGFQLKVRNGVLGLDSSQSPPVTGEATFELVGDETAGEVKVKLKADGTPEIVGGLDVDLSKLSKSLSGKVKLKGGTGGLQELEATGCTFTREPFGTISLDKIKYDRKSGDFETEVALAKDKFSISGVTVEGFDSKIAVRKVGGDINFDGRVAGSVTVGEPAVGKGAIDLTYAGGKLTGFVELKKADLQFGDASVKAEGFKLTLKDGGGVEPGGAPKISIKKPGLFSLDMSATVDGGGLTGFTIDGSLENTSVVKDGKLSGLTWQKGKGITGSATVTLTDLGGLIDPNTTMTVGYDGTNLTAKTSRLAIKSGTLKDWSFEGGLDKGAFAAKLEAPGGEWDLGGTKITVGKSTLAYAGGGVSGNIDGSVEVGTSKVAIAVVVKDNAITSAKATAKVSVKDFVPQLEGTISVNYDNGKLAIKGTGLQASDPEVAKKLSIPRFEYKDKQFSGEALFSGTVELGGYTLKVDEGNFTIDTGKSPPVAGKAKFTITGEVGNATATAEFGADGKLKLEGAVELDLSKFDPERLSGKITLKGGSKGLQSLDVTGCAYKAPWGSVGLKSLSYDKSKDDFAASIAFNVQHFSKPGVTVQGANLDVNLKRAGKKVEIDGHVDGTVLFGDPQVGTGKVDLTYKLGKLTGSAELTSVTLKVGDVTPTVDKFSVKFTEDGKVVANGKASVKVDKPGLANITLTAAVSDNGIDSFSVEGTVDKTPITESVAIKNFTYKKGEGLRGSMDVTLSDLGGLIDAGTTLTFGYDGSKFTAKTSKLVLKGGPLAGWSFEGGLDNGKFGATIEAQGSWSFGGFDLSVKQGTKLTVDGKAVSGNFDASIKSGEQSFDIAVGLANNKITSVKSKGTIELEPLTGALKGQLEVGYDGSNITIKGKGVSAADPDLAKYFKIDNFSYEKGKISGAISASTPHVELGPIVGQVSGSISFDISNGAKKFSGEFTITMGGEGGQEGGAGGKATVKIGPDGKVQFEGDVTLRAEKLTDGWVGGELTISKGAGGAAFSGSNLSMLKGPLANKLTINEAKYKKGDGFGASFTLDNTAVKDLLPGNMTIDGSTTVSIEKKEGGKLQVKASGGGKVTIGVNAGEYFSGTLGIEWGDELKLSVTNIKVKVETSGVKFNSDGFGFEVADKKLKVTSGGKIGVDILDGTVKGDATIEVAGGTVSGVTIDATIKPTDFTKETKIHATYGGDDWSCSAKLGLTELGGLLDGKAELEIGMSKKGGFTAKAENVAITGGVLKGFTIEKAEYSKAGASATVKGGTDFEVSGMKATIDATSRLTVDKSGADGKVSGSLTKVGPIDSVALKLTFKGKDFPDVKATAKLELSKLSDVLTGSGEIKYEGNLKKGKLVATVKSPGHKSVPELAKFVDEFSAGVELGGGGTNFEGCLKLREGAEVDFEKIQTKLKILGGHISFKNTKLNGEVKATFAGEAASGSMTFEVKDNDFSFEIEGEVNLLSVTDGWVNGKVKGKAGSKGAALSIIGPNPQFVKEPLQGIEITALSGNTKSKDLSIAINADAFLAKQLEGIPDVKLTPKGSAALEMKDGKFASGNAGVGGTFVISPGGKEMATGSFEAGFDTAKDGLYANLKIAKFTISDYVEGKNCELDLKTGFKGGSIKVKVPSVFDATATGIVINPRGHQYAFKAKANFDSSLAPLDKVECEAELADGKFTCGAKVKSAITEHFGPVELTIKETTKVELGSNGFSGKVEGSAKIDGDLASGDFTFDVNGTAISGAIHAKVGSNVPVIKAGSPVDVEFANKKLSADVKLELGPPASDYFSAGELHLVIKNSALKADGFVKGPIPKLGRIGEAFTEGTLSFAKGKLSGHGDLDLSKLGDMFESGSKLSFKLVENKPSISGIAKVKAEGLGLSKSEISVDWTAGQGFKVSGEIEGDVPEVGKINMKCSASKGAPGSGSATVDEAAPKFILTGKITADVLTKRFPGVTFAQPPTALLSLENSGGTWDWGLDDLGTRIVGISGFDAADISFNASYTKGGGLNCNARVTTLKKGNVNFKGHFEVVKGKFASGSIGVEAEIPGVDLAGGLDVTASEMDKPSAKGWVDAKPKGDSVIAQFIKAGRIEVDLTGGELKKVEGTIDLNPPDLLKLRDAQVKVKYENGSFSGYLHSDFDVPIGDGVVGTAELWFGGDEKFKAKVSFPFDMPGCDQADVQGSIDASGNVEIGAHFKPRGDFVSWLKGVDISLSYKKGFIVKGSVTIAPSDETEIKVGVGYNISKKELVIEGDFDFNQKKEEPQSESPSLKKDLFDTEIPLVGIGVLNVVLTLRASVGMGLAKPKVKFEKPEFVGGLGAMKGGMPEVKFGGSFGLGVNFTLELGVGIAGQIQLLIASGKIGIEGVAMAILNLMLGTDIKGSFKPGQGADIELNPFVEATLKLRAELHAFIKAKVLGFTVFSKDWNLAGVDLASIPLGTLRPFKPFHMRMGGPGGFSMDTPEINIDPDVIQNGAKKGGDGLAADEANRDAREKVRPVLMAIKRSSAQFSEVPQITKGGGFVVPSLDLSQFGGLDGDQIEFYVDRADQAEDLCPEGACTTPVEKLTKALFLMIAKGNVPGALRIVTAWRHAQIAAMGIDPTDGTDLIAYQPMVAKEVEESYQRQLAEAQAKQAQQDAEHAAAVKKQAADFQKAEIDHKKKEEDIQKEYRQQVKKAESEGVAAQQKVEKAEEEAKKEGVTEKPSAQEKAPPPMPPPPPPPLPKLTPPAPIPPKPPVPIPAKPAPVPVVVKPALPTDPGVAPPSTPGAVKGDGEGPKATAPSPKASPGTAPASTPSKSSTGASQGGGGAPLETSKDAGGGKGGKGGGGGGGPAPAVEAGAPGIISQHRSLDDRWREASGGAAGAKGAPGGAGGAPAAAAPAAGGAAPAGGGAAPAGGAAAPAGGAAAPATGAAPAGGEGGAAPGAGGGDAGLDPTVKAVVDAGKADEQAAAQKAKADEEQYDKKIADKKATATQAETKLNKATEKKKAENEKVKAEKKAKEKKDGEERKPPTPDEFPAGTAEQARTTYSNFVKQKGTGQTFEGWKGNVAGKQYFDFQNKTFGDIVKAFMAVFEKAAPEDALPEPAAWAEKLSTGNVHAGGTEFKPVPNFDPGLALSDDAIKAHEALEKFKATYVGNRPGEYLAAEASKMSEAEQLTFVLGKLLAIAASVQAAQALRVAMEKLGPAGDVDQVLARIDGGKVGEPAAIWGIVGTRFETGQKGTTQLEAAIAELAKQKPAKAPEGAPAGVPGAKGAGGEGEAKPKMMAWAEAAARFEALAGDKAYETTLTACGVAPGGDLGANQKAVLAKKKEELAALAATMKGKPPEEIHAKWLEGAQGRGKAQNLAASGLSKAYAGLILELRTKEPRLDQDAFGKACAAFRQRVGSNALAFTVGNVNPEGIKEAEKIDPAAAQAAAGGADWNPLLVPAWVTGTWEKLDLALFPVEEKKPGEEPKKDEPKKDGAAEAPKDEPKKDAAPAPAPAPKADEKKTEDKKGDDHKDGKKPDPAALEAADKKLKEAFKILGETVPTTISGKPEAERIDLAGKPVADLRKLAFPTFDALSAGLDATGQAKVKQLNEEKGLAPGNEGLPEKYKGELLTAFHTDTATKTMADLMTAKARGGYTFKGKPLSEADLTAAAPDDQSLSRVIGTDKLNGSILSLDIAKDALRKANPKKEPTDDEAMAHALNEIKANAPSGIAKYVANGEALVKFPGWVFPEPSIKNDAVFSEYCDLLALYANWYPSGHLRFTVKRKSVIDKIGKAELKKPTVFDGMQSELWVQRDNRDHNWGKTGGGLREALLKVDWADIDPAKWVCVDIDAKYKKVLDAANKDKAGTADAKDKDAVNQHQGQQQAAAKETQAAQTKEEQGAGNAQGGGNAQTGGAQGSGGAQPSPKPEDGNKPPTQGAANGDAKPKSDGKPSSEPADAPPIKKTFTMGGATHTLTVDPTTNKVEMASRLGEALKKILEALADAPKSKETIKEEGTQSLTTTLKTVLKDPKQLSTAVKTFVDEKLNPFGASFEKGLTAALQSAMAAVQPLESDTKAPALDKGASTEERKQAEKKLGTETDAAAAALGGVPLEEIDAAGVEAEAKKQAQKLAAEAAKGTAPPPAENKGDGKQGDGKQGDGTQTKPESATPGSAQGPPPQGTSGGESQPKNDAQPNEKSKEVASSGEGAAADGASPPKTEPPVTMSDLLAFVSGVAEADVMAPDATLGVFEKSVRYGGTNVLKNALKTKYGTKVRYELAGDLDIAGKAVKTCVLTIPPNADKAIRIHERLPEPVTIERIDVETAICKPHKITHATAIDELFKLAKIRLAARGDDTKSPDFRKQMALDFVQAYVGELKGRVKKNKAADKPDMTALEDAIIKGGVEVDATQQRLEKIADDLIDQKIHETAEWKRHRTVENYAGQVSEQVAANNARANAGPREVVYQNIYFVGNKYVDGARKTFAKDDSGAEIKNSRVASELDFLVADDDGGGKLKVKTIGNVKVNPGDKSAADAQNKSAVAAIRGEIGNLYPSAETISNPKKGEPSTRTVFLEILTVYGTGPNGVELLSGKLVVTSDTKLDAVLPGKAGVSSEKAGDDGLMKRVVGLGLSNDEVYQVFGIIRRKTGS